MKTKFLTLAMIALLAVTSISCSKDEPAPTPPAATTPIAGNGITWTINGTAASKNILTTNYNLQGTAKNIFAVPAGASLVFEINLTGSTPGTYTLGSGNGLYYNFSTTENLTSPTSGSVTITSFANNKVSGTFTASGAGVGVTTISGSFTNIGL